MLNKDEGGVNEFYFCTTHKLRGKTLLMLYFKLDFVWDISKTTNRPEYQMMVPYMGHDENHVFAFPFEFLELEIPN